MAEGGGENSQHPGQGQYPLPQLRIRAFPTQQQPVFPYVVVHNIDLNDVGNAVADRVIWEALDNDQTPTFDQVIQADYLFTVMINLLYSRLQNYSINSDLQSICLFNINRVNAAKTWLLTYYFYFQNYLYVPTKPFNEIIPPLNLEKEHCFPHMNALYFGNTEDEMVNQLIISNRLEIFLTRIIPKCYPTLTPEEVDQYAFSYTHHLALSNLPDLDKSMDEMEAQRAALQAAQAAEGALAPEAAQVAQAAASYPPPPPYPFDGAFQPLHPNN